MLNIVCDASRPYISTDKGYVKDPSYCKPFKCLIILILVRMIFVEKNLNLKQSLNICFLYIDNYKKDKYIKKILFVPMDL